MRHAHCNASEELHFICIDTHNESLLRLGLSVQKYGNKLRVSAAGYSLSRLFPAKFPSPDPDRIIVDHANRDTTNDCEGNLHWVTPEFNSFNTARDEKREGYIGVNQNGVSSTVYHAGRVHGIYTNARTAARVYDLVCTIHYGDQLNKTKDFLNNLPNPEKHVVKVREQPDGVDVYRVNETYIVMYDGHVKNRYLMEQHATAAAQALVSELQNEKEMRKQDWLDRRKKFKIDRHQDGVAFERGGKVAEVLLDKRCMA